MRWSPSRPTSARTATTTPPRGSSTPPSAAASILDLGVYVISFAQDFLGTPDRVVASGTRYPNGTDASVTMHLAYDDGRGASLACGLTTESPGRAVIWGTGGSIELPPRFHHPTSLVVRRNGQEAETHELPARGRGYSHEIEEVGRCLAAGLTESPGGAARRHPRGAVGDGGDAVAARHHHGRGRRPASSCDVQGGCTARDR